MRLPKKQKTVVRKNEDLCPKEMSTRGTIGMSEFPWGVFIILGTGLIFVLYIMYYILQEAHLEMQNEEEK